MRSPQVISSHLVECRALSQIHHAVVIVFQDGNVEVRCDAKPRCIFRHGFCVYEELF